MEEAESKPDSNVKSTVDAVTGLVKAIPIYQDTLQPAAKQIGQSLETVTKCVNICLAPIKALVWGYDKIETFVTERVSEKLRNVAPENITSPKLQIAGPVVEALRFVGHVEELRELYANLLANSMDKSTIDEIHPAFVEVVKNMTPEESRILQGFKIMNTQHPAIDIIARVKDTSGYRTVFRNFTLLHKEMTIDVNDVPTFLDNLCRLNVLEIPDGVYIDEAGTYEPLMNDPALEDLKKNIVAADRMVDYNKKLLELTSFGKRFVRTVVVDKA